MRLLVWLIIWVLLFSLIVGSQIVSVNINNRTEHVVVLLKLTTVCCENFATGIDASQNVVQFKVRGWTLYVALIHHHFHYLIFKSLLLHVLRTFFSGSSPCLLPRNLFSNIILAILFGQEFGSLYFFKLSKMLLLLCVNARFYNFKSILNYEIFII